MNDSIDDKYFRFIFENSLDAILLTKPGGAVHRANMAACVMFRMTEEEICLAGRAGLVDMNDPNLPAALEEREKRGKARVELAYFRKGGERFIGDTTSAIFRDDAGLIWTAMIIRDITKDSALRDAEAKEKQLLKETLQLKDDFITTITHEFRTPIAIINAAVQTMEIVCRTDITDKLTKYISKIKRSSLRQQRLVDNLLDITKIRAGRMAMTPKNYDIVAHTGLIVESVADYAQQKGIRLVFTSDCDSWAVMIDGEKYERIVLNLLSNAIKFSHTDESVYIDLSFQPGSLKLAIVDKGIGIPEEKHGVIFEQFGQVNSSLVRQSEGSGIGLYLVKLLVEEFGGTISLESKENCGSSFTIVLPVSEAISQTTKDIQRETILQAATIEFSDVVF